LIKEEDGSMATMNETGATGWMLGFASAMVDHCCNRLRQDYRVLEREGCSLALRRLGGQPMSRAEVERLRVLGVRLGFIAQQMGGAQRSLVQVADDMGVLGEAPYCSCMRCTEIRRRLGQSLLDYWGTGDTSSPRPWTLLPYSTERSGTLG
jgi:hypothetical protein